MEWREVVEHPSLKDLPFKIETNEWGQIVMTPASGKRGRYQGRIGIWFERLGAGDGVLNECPIQTSKGVRVADIAWASGAFTKKHDAALFFPESPEIVVEVLSPSNNTAEMEEKRKLYFEAGAKEFWLCDEHGDMGFFNPEGEMERSGMLPEFPGHIDIEVA